MNTEGMGHTRLGRFAAVTVPAALVSAGMGYAMLSGMVGAVISSSGGFNLQTDLTAEQVKMRAGATEVGTAGNSSQTIYAETVGSVANGLTVATPAVDILPGVLRVHLSISSVDPSISLGNVALNAATLDTDGATLSNVNMGVAQSQAGFSAAGQDQTTGYLPDGFALTSTGGAGSQSLPGVDSQAYAVTLASLSLSDLSIAVVRD